MKTRFIGLIIVLLSISSAEWAFGQQYPFFYYTTAQGLPQNNVTALAQDGRGFLWIGTDEAGVCRFDGKEFIPFDQHNAGIPNTIRCIATDGASRVFVGTTTGARCLQLSRHAADRPDSAVNAFLSRWNVEIRSISIPRPGEIMLRTSSAQMKIDYYRLRVLEQKNLDDVGRGTASRSIPSVVDRCGRIWSADRNTLGAMTAHDTVRFDERNGLRVNHIQSLLCDREGNIWCGTNEGLVRLTTDRIVFWSEGHGIPTGSVGVWRITEGADHSMWLGTVAHGAVHFGLQKTEYLNTSNILRSNTVSDIRILNARQKIIGTSAGLHMIDGRSVRVLTTRDGLPADHIEFVLPSRNEGYWISTKKGLVHLISQGMRVYTTKDGLPSNRVTQCAEDAYGNLWIGTHAGACTMTRTAGNHITTLSGLLGVRIASIFIDRLNRPWFGSTGSGVHALIDGRLLHITTADGLAGNTVYFVSQDRNGAMYFGTNGGVTVLPESNVRYFIPSDSMRGSNDGISAALSAVFRLSSMFTISTETGLVNNEMNSGGVMRDSAGNMWFGSIGGVTRYTPLSYDDRIECNSAAGLRPPALIVTRMQVGEALVPVCDTLQLGPDDQLLQLRWSIPSYRNSKAVRVLYRLEGLEYSWHESSDGTIVYSGLKPGDYTLVARCTTGENIWSQVQTVLVLSIDPPYYMTIWFWMLILAGMMGLGYLWHRIRTNQLVEIERMRTRIALDLHDDIGASLSSISLLGDVERRHRGGGDNDRIDRIIRLARGSVDSMSDIVWSINPDKDTVRSLAERMQDVAETAGRAANISVSYSMDERLSERAMNAASRRNLMLFFKEAVNNAVKHSGCNQLLCQLRRVKGWMEIIITDNGHGFQPDRDYGGNGLRGMKKRATDMGWNLNVESSPAGTQIHLKVPLER